MRQLACSAGKQLEYLRADRGSAIMSATASATMLRFEGKQRLALLHACPGGFFISEPIVAEMEAAVGIAE